MAGLKGSIGDRSNHSNFSHQNSVKILSEFRRIHQKKFFRAHSCEEHSRKDQGCLAEELTPENAFFKKIEKRKARREAGCGVRLGLGFFGFLRAALAARAFCVLLYEKKISTFNGGGGRGLSLSSLSLSLSCSLSTRRYTNTMDS